MSSTNGKISVVIPVYKSEKSLPHLVSRLLAVLERTSRHFEIILVDDSSPDKSWEVLKELKNKHKDAVKIVRLLTNSGQHNAILCGFSLATGQVIVTMDDDLQNPPEEIPKLVDAVDEGYNLAIGAYASKRHGAFRNAGSRVINWIIKRIFHLPKGFCLTSFRAMRKAVVDGVNQMGGAYPYVTCMLLCNTSNYINVAVRHDPREYGISSYRLRDSIGLVINLLFNYSSYPVLFMGMLCALAFLFCLGYGTMAIYRTIVHGATVPGWASMIVIVSFLNALVLLGLCIFGVYVARLTQQITRTRTRYTIGELHE